MGRRQPTSVPAGVLIHELRIGQCRFAVTPDEAPTHRFCAEPVEYAGCPYCATHAVACFDRRGDAVRREESRLWREAKFAARRERGPAYRSEEDAA